MAIIEWIREIYPQTTMVLAVLVFLPLIWRDKKRLSIKSVWQLLLLELCMMVSGPLMIMLFYNGSGLLMPGILHSGVFGLFLFGPIMIYLTARLLKKDYWQLLDSYAAIMSIYQIINRFSCVCFGCCGGDPIFRTNLHWPVRGAEILFFAIMFAVMQRWRNENRNAGLWLPILSIAYGCFRFVVEWLSVGHELLWGIQISHIWSALTVGVGIGTYAEFKAVLTRRSRTAGNRRK